MKINISIDDVSPHPQSGLGFLPRCRQILTHYPDAKFTLFIPLAYWRSITGLPDTTTDVPLCISQFPDFCEKILKLPIENFEIGVHGYYHGIPHHSNNDEFRYMNYAEAMNRFGEINNQICIAGLKDRVKPIFRPPAFRMNPNSINAARDSGFKVLALSPNNPVFKEYGDLDVSDIVFYDAAPRDDSPEVLASLPSRDFKPLKEGKELRIVYHACEWDKNYLNDSLTTQLIDFLGGLSSRHEFVFMQDLERGNYG